MKKIILVSLLAFSSSIFALGNSVPSASQISDLDLSDESTSTMAPPPTDLDLNSSDDLDIPPADMGGDEDWVSAQ